MDKKLAEKMAEIKEKITDTGETFIDLLAELVAQQIYETDLCSPYGQLLLIEHRTEKWEVSYSSLSRALRKEAKKHTKCIACKKRLAKPCFTINMEDISYLRKRKHQMGTGKGDQHLNKHSPKMKQIEAIIKSLDEYELDDEMKRNIKDNFKDLRPELLTLITGKLGTRNSSIKAKLEITLAIGLLPLLPERERSLFQNPPKPPKYGSKIDVKDYLTFWNYAARLRYFDLMKAKDKEELLLDDMRFHINAMLGFEPPYPCEKHTEGYDKNNMWKAWKSTPSQIGRRTSFRKNKKISTK